MSRRLLATGRYLQGGLEVSQGQDLLLLPSQGNIPTDKFFGTASIPFPSLSTPGRIEDGLWCRGYEATFRQYIIRLLPQNALAAMIPSNCEPLRVLLGMMRRARSKEAFLDHVKRCYGAQQLLPELSDREQMKSDSFNGMAKQPL